MNQSERRQILLRALLDEPPLAAENGLGSVAFSRKVVRYRCALYAVPHSAMAFMIGCIVSPRSERAYSTRGGTSG